MMAKLVGPIAPLAKHHSGLSSTVPSFSEGVSQKISSTVTWSGSGPCNASSIALVANFAETDVATMFRTIATERKKRELDPVLASLYEIRDMPASAEAPEGHNERLDELTRFVEAIGNLSELVLVPEGTDVAELLEMLSGGSTT